MGTGGTVMAKVKAYDLAELMSIVKNGAINGWAGGFVGKENPQLPGATEIARICFASGGGRVEYRDRWGGDSKSFGITTVTSLDEDPPRWLWSMVYGGGLTNQAWLNRKEEILDFLKEMLLVGAVATYFCPRGPRIYRKQHLTYVARWEGDFESFSGEEEIFFEQEQAFAHGFSGGVTS